VEIGPNARAVDIQNHVGTIDAMRRYTGLLGRVRVAIDAVQLRLGREIVSPINRGEFEAGLELQKLPPIIEERIGRLAPEGHDPRRRAEILAEVAHLEHQLRSELGRFAQGTEAEVRGHVEAKDTKRRAPAPEESSRAKRGKAASERQRTAAEEARSGAVDE